MIGSLCPPAIIFLVLTLIQIFIDIFKAYYKEAFFKFIGMVLITMLLNLLCNKGLGIIAWFLVFIPFILMTIISVILLVVFGINPANGDYTVDVENTKTETTVKKTDSQKNTRIDNDDYNVYKLNYYNQRNVNDNEPTNQSTQDITNETEKKTNEKTNEVKYIYVKPKNNTTEIVINTDYDTNESMLNYSNYEPNNEINHRGYVENELEKPNVPESTSINDFLKNTIGKLI